jgi:hypothetical protein
VHAIGDLQRFSWLSAEVKHHLHALSVSARLDEIGQRLADDSNVEPRGFVVRSGHAAVGDRLQRSIHPPQSSTNRVG